MKLTDESREALRAVLATRPAVRRAFFVESGQRPMLAFEYDERPESAEAAKAGILDLLETVAPALGSLAFECGFNAGGPEEIADLASRGEVLYERA